MFEFLNEVNPVFIVIGIIISIFLLFKIIKAFIRFFSTNIGIGK